MTEKFNGDKLNADLLSGYEVGLRNGKIPYLVEFPGAAKLVELGYNDEEHIHDNESYFKGLCKWCYDAYENKGNGQILIGNAIPNSQSACIINLYGNDGVDANENPKFCSGMYNVLNLEGVIVTFGFNNGVWWYKRLNVTETNNTIKKVANYCFNGIIGHKDVDNAKSNGYYIVIDTGGKENGALFYDLLLVYASSTDIRQTWYRVNRTDNKFLIQTRIFRNDVWENWSVTKLDGSNIVDNSIPNAKLSGASVEPAANKIPIADENGMLPVNSIKEGTYNVSINTSGWYRVYTSILNRESSHSIILQLLMSYNKAQNETYTFSISVGSTDKISITQLSGLITNNKGIDKIRVLHKYNTILYIDFHYNLLVNNPIRIHGIGEGTFQKPTLSNDIPEGYVATEFETTNGFKASVLGNDEFKQLTPLETTTNLNTIITPGTYVVNKTISKYNTEYPCILQVSKSGKYIRQTFYDIDDCNIKVRRSNDENHSTWIDWEIVKDLNTADKLISKQLTNEDLNDIKDIDFSSYRAGSGNTCSHKPWDEMQVFYLQVCGLNNNYILQTLTAANGIIYKRVYDWNDWSPWKKMLTEDDLTSIETRLQALENK